jgi:Holliday junction resolvase
MEFKGTKGKWYVSKAHKTINDEKGFGIAQENGHRNSNEWDANALLISKAPEMLEMLIEIKNQIEDGRNYITKEDIEQLIKQATEI